MYALGQFSRLLVVEVVRAICTMSIPLKNLKHDDDSTAGVPPGKFSYKLGQPTGYTPVPITSQPIVGGSGHGPARVDEWMSIPIGIPDCPPGLEYLTSVDQLLVKQKVERLEAITGFETNNKYSIRNALNQNVYYAIEDTDCCERTCLGNLRSFELRVFDNFRNEVIHMYRPFVCCAGCTPACMHHLEVSAPPGNVIGSVEQEWTWCVPSFNIKNHRGEVVLRVKGELCTCSCTTVKFRVLNMNGEKIGIISKQWSGFAREFFTDADFFGINFPLDLDARIKAVLLGATFLIDMNYFEK